MIIVNKTKLLTCQLRFNYAYSAYAIKLNLKGIKLKYKISNKSL